MLWFFLALATAVLWGIGYAVTEKFLHNGVSPAFFMAVTALISVPFYFWWAYYTGTLSSSYKVFQNNVNDTALLLFISLVFVAANVMVLTSVQLKNATLASLIEITYPVFTVLFTWLILQKFHLNLYSIVGGLLIFSGIALIYTKHPQ